MKVIKNILIVLMSICVLLITLNLNWNLSENNNNLISMYEKKGVQLNLIRKIPDGNLELIYTCKENESLTWDNIKRQIRFSSNSEATRCNLTFQKSDVILTLNETSGTILKSNKKEVGIDGENYGPLSCESSNSSIATCTVTQDKLTITGVSVGNTSIKVKDTTSDKEALYTITVNDITLGLSPASGEVIKTKSITSTVTGSGYGTLSCTSSNSSIATCAISGTTLTVTGVGIGTATITVKENISDKTVNFTVTVKDITLGLSPTSGTAVINKTVTSQITGNGYGTLSCTVSNPLIVACSISGNILTITGKNIGSTTVIVKEATLNKTVNYSVTVEILKLMWKKTYGGTSSDYFNKIIAVTDGYIAVGSSSSTNGDLSGLNKGSDDGIIVKYDLNGNVVWKKNYGGTVNEEFLDITAIPNGFIVVGSNWSSACGIIVRYDLNGNQIWSNTNCDVEVFEGIAATTDGIVAIGPYYTGDWTCSTYCYWKNGSVFTKAIKYDLNGNIVWQKTYSPESTYQSSKEEITQIAKTSDGFILVGSGNLVLKNQGIYQLAYSSIGRIYKIDNNGNIVWKKNFSGNLLDRFKAVTIVSDGYVAVGGSDSTNGDLSGLNKGTDDAIIVKYNTSGTVIWKKNFGGNDFDSFYGITATSDGYIAVGNSYSTTGDLSGLIKGGSDGIIIKYDSSGNVVWKRNYGGNGYDCFNSVAIISNKFSVVGESSSTTGDLEGLNKGNTDGIIFSFEY